MRRRAHVGTLGGALDGLAHMPPAILLWIKHPQANRAAVNHEDQQAHDEQSNPGQAFEVAHEVDIGAQGDERYDRRARAFEGARWAAP